jgi:hypothetical protein
MDVVFGWNSDAFLRDDRVAQKPWELPVYLLQWKNFHAMQVILLFVQFAVLDSPRRLFHIGVNEPPALFVGE